MTVTSSTLELAIELFINENSEVASFQVTDTHTFEIQSGRTYIPEYLIKRKQNKEDEWLVYASVVAMKGSSKRYATNASFCIKDVESLLNFIVLYRLQVQLRPNKK